MSVGLVQILIVVALIAIFFAPKKIAKWGGDLGQGVRRARQADPEGEDGVSQAVKAAKMARKLHRGARGGFPWK